MSEPQPSRAQQLLGDFAPKMVSLTDDVLFGDVWERTELSPRHRSLITARRADRDRQHRATTRPPRQSAGERPDRHGAQGRNHPPRVLHRGQRRCLPSPLQNEC